MNKNLLTVILFFSFMSILLNGCQNATETTYDNSHVRGYILDSISRNPLDSVSLNIPDVPVSTITYPNGYYQFLNIHMPRPTWGVSLVATRNGYATRTLTVNLIKGDTATVNIGMLHY